MISAKSNDFADLVGPSVSHFGRHSVMRVREGAVKRASLRGSTIVGEQEV
jgi:hypothetical protein